MASSQGKVSVSSESVMSAQELMKQPNFTIPKSYIVEPPAVSQCYLSLPTIDMNRFAFVEEFHLQLHKLDSILFAKNGASFSFFGQLVNHGVSSELLEKMRYELEAFYKLPFKEKMKYKIRAGDIEGYGNRARSEGKLDWASRLFMLTNPVQRRKPYLFPQLPSSLRETLEAYLLEMQKLGMRLLGLMAKALKINEKELEMFGDGVQAIRMSYYPPCPKPELVIGITPHSDACGITIVNQVNGVDGLQIKRDGVWFPVTFLPSALVVNIGDILQILSNGVYQSVEHRAAINSEKERMSIGFFMLPKFEAEIGPSPSLLNPQNPPLYRREGMEQYSTSFIAGKLNGLTMLEHLRIEHKEKPKED